MAEIIRASDSFAGADVNPINTNWSLGGGSDEDFRVLSHAAAPATGSADATSVWDATVGLFADNQFVNGNLTVTGTGGGGVGIGFWLRHPIDGSIKTGYRMVLDHAAASNVEVLRFITGTPTTMFHVTQAWTNGDLWGLKVYGPAAATVVECWYQGAKVGNTTDNSSVASGYAGLAYSSTATSPSVDNWEAGDIVPDSATVAWWGAAG